MEGAYSSCIVCGHAELHPLPRYSAAHLVRCGNCGLTFAGLRPSDAELAAHYGSYGTGWFDSEITRQRYRQLLDSFEPFRRDNRILDMGCGAGYFLEEAAKRGWEAYGTEFGEHAIELSRGRGFTVVSAPLAPGSFADGHFDVVTSFEVVEHLRDPLDEAQTLAALVRPGGALYCTTPNFNALSRRLLHDRWRVISYPEHLIYFTGPTLQSWLGPHGFAPRQIESTGISLAALRQLAPGRAAAVRAGAGAPDADSVDQRVRAAAESRSYARLAKTTINRVLTQFGAGDTLKALLVRH